MEKITVEQMQDSAEQTRVAMAELRASTASLNAALDDIERRTVYADTLPGLVVAVAKLKFHQWRHRSA